MKVLLFSMPDAMPMFNPEAWRPPNLGTASLAANAPDHDVRCADLIVKREDVTGAVHEAMDEVKPDLVGLSAMSFQYHTAVRVAEIVRRIDPEVPLVLGGYHATLLSEDVIEHERSTNLFDYIIRGEGESSFRLMLDEIVGKGRFEKVPGLCWKKNGKWVVNERGPNLDLDELQIPKRSSRLWNGRYFFRGVQRRAGLWAILRTKDIYQSLDVLETSRGCTMPCTFCSMSHMYGRTFRRYDLDRVMDDIADSKTYGTQWIAFADDNITLDIKRFEALCDAIIRAGHNDVSYIIQASSAGISSSERLVRKMDMANFRIVFLGIENVSERNLRTMKKGQIVEKTRTAVQYLHKYDILIVGGMIVGFPDDEEIDIRQNFEFFREQNIDFSGDQVLTPYPRTGARDDLLKAGVVTNRDDFRWYNGFWANVKTKYLTPDQLQFIRWKFRRKYSTFFRTTPTMRAAYPLYTMFRALIIRPYRWVRDLLHGIGRTDYDLYREEMERCAAMNHFFDDEHDFGPVGTLPEMNRQPAKT